MYVTTEELTKAKEIDLLTYLMNNEPYNLKRESNNSYCTKDHDSLKISNGLWYWFSQGIGGKTALDYLIKVKGYTLPQAVERINGRTIEKSPVFCSSKQNKTLNLPEISDKANKVYLYLKGRGIHSDVLNYCIDKKLIMETEKYHNVVFAGYDEAGKIRYANLRGINSEFKGEATGSDKRYSFKICDNPNAQRIHVFESAIDLISHISLQIMSGRDWTKDAYLSLGGVSVNSKEVPVPLKYYLDKNILINTIYLHLDNDEAGKLATGNLINHLYDKYRVIVQLPVLGKDINEDLMILTSKNNEKEERDR